ncbi:MAG TPA: helix-turn-helix transcriptional regulator [Candidatus Limnocylindrales bacterium]|nr:helix-turn-helix transcriptional regulator [Candidatus Limnocylindrales bacterium]
MTALPVLDAGPGSLLRQWRLHRRMSQLDLSNRAGVSTRHLSFVETGRAQPSRELLLHLGRALDIPMRDCNRLLLAAGFAPVFGEVPLDAPEQRDTLAAVERVLNAHEPWPALVVDRYWNVVSANNAAMLFVEEVAPELLVPPVNVLRVCLHPEGLAPRIGNLGTMAHHVLGNLQRQIDALGDPELAGLADELRGYLSGVDINDSDGGDGLSVLMELRRGENTLRFVSLIATFGSAVDATTSELVIETFLPADDETAVALSTLALSAGTASPAPR